MIFPCFQIKYALSVVCVFVCITGYSQNLQPELGLRTGKVLYPDTIQHLDRGLPTSHLLLDMKDRVGIKLVSYYQTSRDLFLVQKFDDVGYVTMRRTEKGPVSIFKFSKETYNPYWVGGGSSFNNYTFYQYNDELKTLTNDNLKKSLKHDEQSVLMIKKMVRNNFIRVGIFAGGLALTAVGISKMFVPNEEGVNRFEFKPNLPFLAGIPIMVLSVTIGKEKRYDLEDVVKGYNHRNK